MCQPILSKSTTWYCMAIVMALISGFSSIELLHEIGEVISNIFIKIFKCISLPIIALSIMATLSQYHSHHALQALWKKTLVYTIGTTIIAASVACLIYVIIAPDNVLKTSVFWHTETQGRYGSHLEKMIPSNIFSPFLEHQVLSGLILSVAIGIAIQKIPHATAKQTITQMIQALHHVFLIITGWIIRIIPLALFGFITTLIVQMKSGSHMQGLTEYFIVIILANLTQGLIVLPIFLKFHGICPWTSMKGMMPALSVAFFSKSSAGTLPITMETAERNLGIRPQISRSILPLCTSINMNGCAAFIFVTVMYLMQNAGMPIHASTMMLWIVIATIAAIGNAGVPMGCFFLSASLLASMNVPIVLMGMILPLYSMIDMIETALNVWSDACVTQVIDHQAQNIPEIPSSSKEKITI